MRRWVAGLAAAAGLCAAGPAGGHVAPSRDVNNRYVKLTLLGDRVRLAYTVYFGELPGAVQRRTIDRDRDGALSADESAAFGRTVADAVAPALSVRVDGRAIPTTWALVDVGLGAPTTRGGSFSVDLVAWYCAGGGATHTVELVDRYAVPRPGETELRIEDGPGVRVRAAALGGHPLTGLDARWEGPGGPITERGVRVSFDAGPNAQRPDDGRCRADDDGSPPWLWLGAGAPLIAGAAWWLRRRAQRKMNG